VFLAAILADQLIHVFVLLVPLGAGEWPETAIRHLEAAVSGFIQRLLVLPCLLAVLFRLFFADAGLQSYRFARGGFCLAGFGSCFGLCRNRAGRGGTALHAQFNAFSLQVNFPRWLAAKMHLPIGVGPAVNFFGLSR